MAPEEGGNVRNKLITITLAVIFMIKTETEETIAFLSHFYHRYHFNLRGPGPPGPPSEYADAPWRRA